MLRSCLNFKGRKQSIAIKSFRTFIIERSEEMKTELLALLETVFLMAVIILGGCHHH